MRVQGLVSANVVVKEKIKNRGVVEQMGVVSGVMGLSGEWRK